MKNTDEFRFAVMGAGHIARKFCDAVALVPGCAVAAVASKSLERAQALADEKGVPAAYGDYAATLDEVKPDAVYVATTADAHYALSKLCVERGCPVLCEKAMFMTAREADDVFDLAEKKGVFAMEALWSRFLPAVNKARDWLKDGLVGQPVMAGFDIGFRAPDDPNNRYFNPALGGGAAFDLTVYGLQILTWTLGRTITRAYAAASPAMTGVDGSSIVLLDLQGLPATVRSSLLSPMGEGLTIVGREGRIVVPHAHYASEATLYGPDGSEIERWTDETTENGFTYEIEEVVRCVRAGLTESPVVPHASTRDCARIYDMIYAALA